eukprot:Opistho-2@36315
MTPTRRYLRHFTRGKVAALLLVIVAVGACVYFFDADRLIVTRAHQWMGMTDETNNGDVLTNARLALMSSREATIEHAATVDESPRDSSNHASGEEAPPNVESVARSAADVPAMFQLVDSANSVSHWKLNVTLLSWRRNHDCTHLGDKLILLPGRFAANAESYDMNTGAQAYMTLPNDDRLRLSHFVGLHVDGGRELWIPCSFVGSTINTEESAKSISILDTTTVPWGVRKGPALDPPRGGCGALLLHVTSASSTPDVCVFGGSVGSHDKGEFLSDVSCYNRDSSTWHKPLPSLPVVADHVNVVTAPAFQCPDGRQMPQRVFFLNFREAPYGKKNPSIYALDLLPNGSKMQPAPAGWYVFARDDDTEPRDAAGTLVSPSGRFLLMFGGLATRNVHDNNSARNAGISWTFVASKEIRAFDTCSKRWIANIARFSVPRFAIETCKVGEFAVTCGGASGNRHIQDQHGNMGDCEAFRLSDLEEAALARANALVDKDASADV